VEQSNFHDYTVLRMNEMPKVEVHIVPSQKNPTGVGEPGVPPDCSGGVQRALCSDGQTDPHVADPFSKGRLMQSVDLHQASVPDLLKKPNVASSFGLVVCESARATSKA